MLPTSCFFTPSVGGPSGEGVNHPTTHVEAYMEMSRDAGSIPAASTKADLREIASRLFSCTFENKVALQAVALNSTSNGSILIRIKNDLLHGLSGSKCERRSARLFHFLKFRQWALLRKIRGSSHRKVSVGSPTRSAGRP